MVLVISFDRPENVSDERDLLAGVVNQFRPVLENVANRHIWVGIEESAEAVLNAIGID